MTIIYDTGSFDEKAKFIQDKINMKLDVLSELSNKAKNDCLLQAIDLSIAIYRKKNEINNANNGAAGYYLR